jgi:hypothetical protein
MKSNNCLIISQSNNQPFSSHRKSLSMVCPSRQRLIKVNNRIEWSVLRQKILIPKAKFLLYSSRPALQSKTFIQPLVIQHFHVSKGCQ